VREKMPKNKIFLIHEKHLDAYNSTFYLFLIVAKDIKEACKIGDIDIPNDYFFKIFGSTDLESQLLLECSRDICNHLEFELGELLEKLI